MGSEHLSHFINRLEGLPLHLHLRQHLELQETLLLLFARHSQCFHE